MTLPQRLAPMPPRLRVPLRIIWLILFVATLAAQVGGLSIAWLAIEEPFELLVHVGPGSVATVALLTAAALLVRRRPEDPVSLLLSLSFLAAGGYVGPAENLYYAFDLEVMDTLLPSLWMGFMVAALPAFPNGVFVPRRGVWLTLLALPFTLAISADVVAEDELVLLGTTFLGFGIGIAAIATVVIRYRRTPPGLEKQQLKWAALGFAGSIVMLIAAIVIGYSHEAEVFPESWQPFVMFVAVIVRDVSFTVLALGILVSLLRFRLWDADRAIGRSAGYALITLILACVWAASSTIVNELVSSRISGAGKGMNAAVSTIIAALVFGPATGRVNKWVEKRFQRGVLRLRELPDKLAVWQHLDDPAAFGGRVARAVADSVHADRCAVLLFDGAGFRVLAVAGTDPSIVTAWIAAQGSFSDLEWEAPGDADFPLRIILTDEEVLIGAVLVGRRSDGGLYAKEERGALFGLEPPLAAALHRVQKRTMRGQEFGTALAALDQRLARVETALPPSV